MIFLPYKKGNRIYGFFYSGVAILFLLGGFEAGFPKTYNEAAVWALGILSAAFSFYGFMNPDEGFFSYRRDWEDIKDFFYYIFFMDKRRRKEE